MNTPTGMIRKATARRTGHAAPRLMLIALSVWLVSPSSEAQIRPMHASTPTHQTLMDYAATKAGSLSTPLTFASTQNTRMWEGARDEDGACYDLNTMDRSTLHGYNPLLDKGFLKNPLTGERFGTARDAATNRWGSMVSAFMNGNFDGGDGYGAWHFLGRVSHLLQDMSSPLHSLGVSHPAADFCHSACLFEGYWETNDANLRSAVLSSIGGPLHSSTLDAKASEKLDLWSASRLQYRFNNSCPNKTNDDVRGWVEVLAWITYYRATFWGEVTMGSSSGNGSATSANTSGATFSDGNPGSQANALHTMFHGNVRWINLFLGDDYYEIQDQNGSVFRFMSQSDIDDWAACGRSWAYGQQDSSSPTFRLKSRVPRRGLWLSRL